MKNLKILLAITIKQSNKQETKKLTKKILFTNTQTLNNNNNNDDDDKIQVIHHMCEFFKCKKTKRNYSRMNKIRNFFFVSDPTKKNIKITKLWSYLYRFMD